MPTITAEISAAVITPSLILPWRTVQAAGNVFHDIQGASTPWVSLQATRSRAGELRIFFTTEAAAEAARVVLRAADTFTIAYAERTSLEFTFAVDGSVQVELDSETSDHWYVQFGYREVT